MALQTSLAGAVETLDTGMDDISRFTILYHRTELGFRIRHLQRYCLLAEYEKQEKEEIDQRRSAHAIRELLKKA